MRYTFSRIAVLAAFAWTISLTPPSDIKANFDAPSRVTVKDEAGAPVKGAEVEMVVTMVDMDHGAFKHAAREISPGTYEAPATKFYMVGTWNLKVTARKGSESAVKDFKIDVKH